MEAEQTVRKLKRDLGLKEPVGLGRQVGRMLWESNTGLLGLGVILLIILTALSAELITPHDPLAQDIPHRLAGPFWMTGSADHLLGTDSLGRDILARIIFGTRISLLVGLSSVFLSGSIGVPLGLVAGYFRGWLDAAIMRLADIQLAIPTMVLALTIMALLGPSLVNVIIVLGVTGWVVYARVVRGEVLSVREKEFVEAALATGATHGRVLLFHILPNVSSSIIVISSLRVATMILLEATLSFLGLGVQPPTPTWGGMVAEGRDFVSGAWWVSTLPGIAILIAVLGINFLGDWLRDVLDPRLRI